MTDPQQPAEQPPNATPAGWYPHPTMAGTQAYWDGEKWTDHVAPDTAKLADGSTSAAAKVFLLLVAAAAIVALVLIAGALVN